MNLCPVDKRPVEIIMDIERLRAEKNNYQWYRPDIKSMWRFGSLLALDVNDEVDRRSIVSLGEGYTPLLALNRYPLSKKAGFKLYLKDEGQPHSGYGRNPTGSFKDRGMSMVASMAKKMGLQQLAVPTQGNAGDSLTEYALHAGFEIAVAMPDDTGLFVMQVNYLKKNISQRATFQRRHFRNPAGVLKEKRRSDSSCLSPYPG
jgi:threonine synthase